MSVIINYITFLRFSFIEIFDFFVFFSHFHYKLECQLIRYALIAFPWKFYGIAFFLNHLWKITFDTLELVRINISEMLLLDFTENCTKNRNNRNIFPFLFVKIEQIFFENNSFVFVRCVPRLFFSSTKKIKIKEKKILLSAWLGKLFGRILE